LPKTRIIRPVGNTVKKYTSESTIGAIIEPRNIPNLNQRLFGRDNILGAKRASINNKADNTIAQIRMPLELVKGYKATIKKTIEKTKPKDFSEDCSMEILLDISIINIL
jgi:hypothetical protein